VLITDAVLKTVLEQLSFLILFRKYTVEHITTVWVNLFLVLLSSAFSCFFSPSSTYFHTPLLIEKCTSVFPFLFAELYVACRDETLAVPTICEKFIIANYEYFRLIRFYSQQDATYGLKVMQRLRFEWAVCFCSRWLALHSK